MTSREWFKKVTEELATKNFHVTNKKYGNGYFIFDTGDDSVIHFGIKEVKGWLFGIWFEFDEEDSTKVIKATFFTRHEDDLDKFKPSRSYFRKDIEIKDEFDEFDVHYISELCTQFKQHPILSYCIDNQNSYMGGYGFVIGNLFYRYVKERLYYLRKKVRDYYNNTSTFNLTALRLNRIKKVLEKETNYIKDVFIRDNNADGFICSPRYEMVITWNFKINEDKEIPVLYTMPFYKCNGKPKFSSNKASVEWHYLDDNRHFTFTPDEEDLEITYGWRYKLYNKLFKSSTQKI